MREELKTFMTSLQARQAASSASKQVADPPCALTIDLTSRNEYRSQTLQQRPGEVSFNSPRRESSSIASIARFDDRAYEDPMADLKSLT
ncbi:conserved hypothetical protein [Ricinus communis]|uniref:Uncharacterized protein n=1 Tax=Ricinus communis TaxID=3988 RepID=B9S622_RICCO|nr:conserved hypothetical protein [Ricinus communis]